MSKGSKKQYKLYMIESAKDALLVLSTIIIPVIINLEKFNKYSDEAALLTERYKPGDMIPADIYEGIHDKLLFRQRELLRYISDHQNASFSYIEVRDILTKRGYLKRSLPSEVQEILTELLNIRNWSFHNTQSKLVAEKVVTNKSIPKEIADAIEILPQLNPLIVRKTSSYPWEMLASFIKHNVIRSDQFEAVLREMKADYQRMYDEYADSSFMFVCGKLSRDVQYIEVNTPYNMNGIDANIASLSMGIQKGQYDGTDKAYEKLTE